MPTIADLRAALLDRGVQRSYSIAFTPRCGSTALTHLLQKEGLGNPTEYFQYPYDTSKYWNWLPGETVAARFVELVSRYQVNGIFASKQAHDHRAFLEGQLEMELGLPLVHLDEILPDHRWIFMHRADLVDQAISTHVARSSGVWHLLSGVAAPERPAVAYDYVSILARLHQLMGAQFNWELYFRTRGIRPLVICYEDFLAETGTVWAATLAHLGVESDSEAAPRLESDAGVDRLSARWHELYEDLRVRFVRDFLDAGKDRVWNEVGDSLARWGEFFDRDGWRQVPP